MPTRAQDARALRIGTNALAAAAAAIEHGQAWRDAVEARASTSDEREKLDCSLATEREAILLSDQVASLIPVGFFAKSDRDRFAAKTPEIDAALKVLEAAAKAALDVSVKRGVQDANWGSKPEDWKWLDTLERAAEALGEVLRAATEDKPAAPAPRLVVRRVPPSITLDGVAYGLTEAQAVFVDILVQNLGHLVQPADFKREPLMDSVRPARLMKKLPESIRNLIQGSPGAGYKMTLP